MMRTSNISAIGYPVCFASRSLLAHASGVDDIIPPRSLLQQTRSPLRVMIAALQLLLFQRPFPAVATLSEQMWSTSGERRSPTGPQQYPTYITNPDGSNTTIYTANLCPSSFTSRDFCSVVPYKTLNPDGSTTDMAWSWNGSPPTGVPSSAIFNPYIQYTAQTPASGGLSRGTYASEDPNGNVTALSEYDWTASTNLQKASSGMLISIPCQQGSSAPCGIRTTSISYYANPINNSSQSYWIHGAPTYLRAKNLATVSNSVTTYSYDNPLTTANLLQLQQADSVNGGSVTSLWTYLSNGNLSTQTDPNGNLTVICYDSNNLYPVSRVVAASNSSCPNPTEKTEGRKTTYVFSFNSGLETSETDVDNSITTSYSYDDLGRQTSLTQTGAGLSRTTTTSYDDINLAVTTTQDDTSTQKLVTTVYSDALGRLRYTVDGAGDKVQKAYRYGSHVSYELESNPYVSTTDPTMGWTVTTRDSIGRVTNVETFLGASGIPPAPWGSNSTSSGTTAAAYDQTTSGCPSRLATTLTDQANLSHINCYDGLGRLVAVTEQTGNVTSYSYDLLDNLLTVDIGGQPGSSCGHGRCFSYGFLTRLTSATNPESGTVSYQYDNNGNVTQQTDARSTVIAISGYDGLNRPHSKTYTAGANTASTPNVSYTYDQDFKGALSSVSTSVSTTLYKHDGFGRTISGTQSTVGNSTLAPFQYTYSYTDQLIAIQYPSGRTVTYGLDGADRVTAVQTVKNGTPTNYASNITYTAPGGISSLTLGNGVTEHVSWNDRSQPMALQANSTSGSILNLGFYPCPNSTATYCSTGNNGNLQSQSIALPSLSLTQSYSYDSLNRLIGASEGTSGWQQSYGFDSAGNRWVSNNSSNLPALTLETPQASTNFSNSSVPNRIAGWSYDAAGNVTQVSTMARTFIYDAENRQVSATIGSGTTTYAFDGNGLRVSKTSNGQTTYYVYDAWGNLAAEYGSSTGNPCDTLTCYVTVDHLGSTRLLTDSSGTVSSRYDYLPFGEEIFAGVDGRTTSMGYTTNPDGFDPKYTGQYRDLETNLDWFNVRHMSGPQGRFQSPDPGNAGANPADPQTWNGYAYVGNNPLSYTDPSGLGIFGDIGSIIGSFFPGLGTLIGWGVGSIADLATGQSISPPGFNIGSAIFGSIAGSVNNGPWSGAPGLSSGGGLNTGGVFGSGDAGPFINNFAEGDPAGWQIALSNTADVIAGAGDTISFGVSAWFRRKMAGKDPRSCNGYYKTGGWIGVGLSTATGAAAGLEKAGAAGAGKEFSHWIPARLGGPRTVLNGNYVSTAEHALSDPYRYRFMPRVWKEANPLPGAATQQLNRVPSVLTGAGIGAAWGAVGRFLGGACGGN